VWLYIPSAYSADAEGSTSPSNSPPTSSDWESVARSLTSNGKSPQPQYLRRVSRTDRFHRLQFGLMSQPSMATAWRAWLTSYTADSPAQISALPESAKASPAPPRAFGLSTSESFARFDRDGSLLRTCPPSLWETPDEPFSANLPASGSMRSGSLYARPTWVPHINGGECLSSRDDAWMTPNVPNGGRSMTPEDIIAKGNTAGGKRQVHLSNQVTMWPTARGSDGEKGGPNQAGSKGDLTLPSAAAQWPTPQAHDVAAGNPARVGRFGTKHGGRNLTDDVMAWPTPAGRDWKSGEASEATATKNARPLNEVAIRFPFSPQDLTTSADGSKYSAVVSILRQHFQVPQGDWRTKMRLNPHFVDWLMCWPPGHTDAHNALGQVETASWRSRALRHLSSLFAESQEVRSE